jgi:hypothetical protein
VIKRNDDQYIDGLFTWFTGKIEDINDPENLNRVKVRCFGFYDDSIAINDLPWATVMMPVTSASIQGNGGNHHLEAEVKDKDGNITEAGSWVVGFFRDGPSAQDPIIMGSIATQTNGIQDIPSTSSTTNKVHHTKAGHKIEFENKDGDEKIIVQHAKGAKITIDKDNNLSITNSGTTNITSDGIIRIESKIKTTVI